jgi:hypothetical protein
MQSSTSTLSGLDPAAPASGPAPLSKRITVVILWGALAVVAAMTLLWEFVPLKTSRARLENFPTRSFGFASREIPLSEGEKSIFGKADVLKRVYQVGGQRVVTQIVDGTNDRHAVHDPMHCFRGAGWELTRGVDLPVGGGAARQITLQRGNQTAEAMYWFSNGQSRHASAMRCWWQTSLRRMTFGHSGDEPLLIILQPLSGENLDWPKLIADFGPIAEL